MRSLVIEDEPQIGAYLGRLLGQLRGIVDIVGSVSEAKQALGNFKYDLAIVDRMLPDGDALDIVTALSQLPERPAFILLTARDAKEDVIDGLNSGADDYLSKPFEPQEFIARVRAVLRRPRLLVPSILSFGNVELHVGANEVTVASNKVLLRRPPPAPLPRRSRAATTEARRLPSSRAHRFPPRSCIPTHRAGRCRPSHLLPSVSPLAATGVAA
jgi:two-component system OmpR family response regulator